MAVNQGGVEDEATRYHKFLVGAPELLEACCDSKKWQLKLSGTTCQAADCAPCSAGAISELLFPMAGSFDDAWVTPQRWLSGSSPDGEHSLSLHTVSVGGSDRMSVGNVHELPPALHSKSGGDMDCATFNAPITEGCATFSGPVQGSSMSWYPKFCPELPVPTKRLSKLRLWLL